MKRLHFGISVLCIAFLSQLGVAAVMKGVSLPDETTVGGKRLFLNGIGTRQATMFNVDVYVAGLYNQTKTSDGNAILASPGVKQMRLRFLRDVEKGKMLDAFKSGLNKCEKNCDAVKNGLTQLSSRLPDMKEKGEMIFTFFPDRVEAKINPTGPALQIQPFAIAGADFSRELLGVWLSDRTELGDLRKQLLAKKD